MAEDRAIPLVREGDEALLEPLLLDLDFVYAHDPVVYVQSPFA